jgi:endonuclease/exonuclease/phosphatase family metal-dependent hydrolase
MLRRRCRLADPGILRVALFLTVLVPGCAGRPAQPLPSAPRLDVGQAACRRSSAALDWHAPSAHDERALHDAWCGTVGPPAIAAHANPAEGADSPRRALTVVSWNTHGGMADVDALLRALRARSDAEARDVVLLLQEVVRRSADLPSALAATAPVPRSLHGPGQGEDVVALAARLGMSLVYVPSMRNGRTDAPGPGEDRGNAILSSLPLTEPAAIELPLSNQRRVAVAATLGARVAGAPAALRVVSFHFDTTRGRARQAAFLGDWLRQESGRGLALVVGGDVNAIWGTRDAAYEALTSALPVEACGRRRTNRWPWRLHALFGWWRGRLDYVFSTLSRDATDIVCATWPAYLDSDHLPVVMDLVAADRSPRPASHIRTPPSAPRRAHPRTRRQSTAGATRQRPGP